MKEMDVSRGLTAFRGIRVRSKATKGAGLSRLETGRSNLFVAFATQPGNVAADGLPGDKNSPFSKGVILNIEQKLEGRELLTMVRASVAKLTNYKQIPWEQNSLLKSVYR